MTPEILDTPLAFLESVAGRWLALCCHALIGCASALPKAAPRSEAPPIPAAPAISAAVAAPAVADAEMPTLRINGETGTTLFDVPLYVSRDGRDELVQIGYVRAGVDLFLLGYSGGEYLSVLTAFPGELPHVLTDASYHEGHFKQFGLNALVPRVAPMREQARLGDLRSGAWGYHRALYLEPGWGPFSLVRCARVRTRERRDLDGVLNVQRHWVFVAAEYPQGELWGWMREPDGPEQDRQWDLGCHSPEPHFAPSWDYRPAAPLDRPLEQRMKAGEEFYVIRREGEELACKQVRLSKNARTGGLLANFLLNGVLQATHDFSAKGVRAWIDAAPLAPDGKLLAGCGCVPAHLRAVAADGDSIQFVEYGATVAEDREEVVYFLRDAGQWWDRSEGKCRERLAPLQAIWKAHGAARWLAHEELEDSR